MPTSLAMLRRSCLLLGPSILCTGSEPPITHNQGVHNLDIFISGGILGAARPPIIFDALSPPLKLCCLFFHYGYKVSLSQGFPWGLHEFPWEAFLSYRSTSLITALISSFSILQMSLKVLYISNQAWPHAFHTPNVLRLDRITDWQDFVSMNLTEAYRTENFLITPRDIDQRTIS